VRQEVVATLLDEGQYLCSPRTMYRLLAAQGEVRERRDRLVHLVLPAARARGDGCEPAPLEPAGWAHRRVAAAKVVGLDRLLEPENESVTLSTLLRSATAPGSELSVQLRVKR
jgi:hypothetical protein